MSKEIDNILTSNLIRNELKAGIVKTRKFRQQGCDPADIKPPQLRFLSTFNSAIYDPRKKKVFEGPWNKMHLDIAADSNLNWTPLPDSYLYYSCQIFATRRLEKTKVLILDTTSLFKPEDLTAINKDGYLVMSPNYHWLTKSPLDESQYVSNPSILYPDFSF